MGNRRIRRDIIQQMDAETLKKLIQNYDVPLYKGGRDQPATVLSDSVIALYGHLRFLRAKVDPEPWPIISDMLNEAHVPGPSGGGWMKETVMSHVARATSLNIAPKPITGAELRKLAEALRAEQWWKNRPTRGGR